MHFQDTFKLFCFGNAFFVCFYTTSLPPSTKINLSLDKNKFVCKYISINNLQTSTEKMAHLRQFRPFHQYNSYYPYYLPSYYSSFNNGYHRYFCPNKYWLESQPAGNHYDRYFEPTEYLLEKQQPIVELESTDAESNRNLNKLFQTLMIVALIYIIYKNLRMK